VSRFDKYDPFSGGFRARLNAAIESAAVGVIQAVSINSSGRVVVGGATLDLIRGVICPVATMAAGDVIDVMTAGEIADATNTAGSAFTAGDVAYAHADGSVNATATAGLAIAQLIELDRAVVRVGVGAMTSAVANTAPLVELGDLADVDLTGATDGQQLTYELATTTWKPGASGV
jgi:hypothetical protein